MKTPREGWTCTKCRRVGRRVVKIANEKTGELLFLCDKCILKILPVMPIRARRQIRAAIVKQGRR